MKRLLTIALLVAGLAVLAVAVPVGIVVMSFARTAPLPGLQPLLDFAARP